MANSTHRIKLLLTLAILLLFVLAAVLWLNTPDLFAYFNQAFCAH